MDSIDQSDVPVDVPEIPEVQDISAVNEMPDDEVPQTGLDILSETNTQINEAVSEIRQIDGIQPDQWQALDFDARLATLQNVEDTMAHIQGRPQVAVTPQEMGEGVFGSFDGQAICINQDQLGSDMPAHEFVDTVVHEGRHAYQDYLVSHPEIVSDSTTVSQWAENLAPGLKP